MASLRRKFALVLAAAAVVSSAAPALGALIPAHEWTISPNKSWEGLFGSVAVSSLVSCLFMGATGFGWGKSLALGAAAALFGTTGDLVEFGRRYNPPDPVRWANGVRSLIRRLKTENNNRLPGKRPRARKIAFP